MLFNKETRKASKIKKGATLRLETSIPSFPKHTLFTVIEVTDEYILLQDFDCCKVKALLKDVPTYFSLIEVLKIVI